MRINPWWIVGGGAGALLLLLTSKPALAAVTQALPKSERTKKILEIAAARNIPPAVALAIMDIESGGAGFAKDGRMIIRYEPHIFRKYGKGEVPAERGGQKAEWRNLEKASAVDHESALKSISMGMAQIMGFNYKMIGYKTVQDMYDALSKSEEAQILSFFDFIKSRGIEDEARAGKWTAFARAYNGAGQKGYDTKMEKRHQYYVDRGYKGVA